jgi:hypothetical protein
MGFVTQAAAGTAEVRAVVSGLPGRADDAASHRLGAKTAIRTS